MRFEAIRILRTKAIAAMCGFFLTVGGSSFVCSQPLPRLNGLHVGFVRNDYYKLNYMSFGYERQLMPRFSLGGTFALSPSHPTTAYYRQRIFMDFALDARYYFALRRQKSMSGFFVGLCLSHLENYHHINSLQFDQQRQYYTAIGTIIGYQHAIGEPFRLSGGIIYGYHPRTADISYDATGKVLDRFIARGDLNLSFFIRMGFTL
jgi:hypothetical protein